MGKDTSKATEVNNDKADTIYGLVIEKHTIVSGAPMFASDAKGKEDHVTRVVGRIHLRIAGSPYTLRANVTATGRASLVNGKPDLKGTMVTKTGLKVNYGWAGKNRLLVPDSADLQTSACESLLSAWRTWYAGLSAEARKQASEKETRGAAVAIATDLNAAEAELF